MGEKIAAMWPCSHHTLPWDPYSTWGLGGRCGCVVRALGSATLVLNIRAVPSPVAHHRFFPLKPVSSFLRMGATTLTCLTGVRVN